MGTNDEALRYRAPFAEGDTAMVYDRRLRRYRVTLEPGALIETHLGYVRHDDVIGRREGFFLITNKGSRLFVARPSFADAVKELPRQSQVIYPKDLAALLIARRHLPRRAGDRDRAGLRGRVRRAAAGRRLRGEPRNLRSAPGYRRTLTPQHRRTRARRAEPPHRRRRRLRRTGHGAKKARPTGWWPTFPSRGGCSTPQALRFARAACSRRTFRRCCRRTNS